MKNTDDSYFSSKDELVYKKSGILKNIPKITDFEELQKFEDKATTLRLFEAQNFIKQNRIDFKLWKNIHRILFQDVYKWAGQVRKVQMSKGSTIFSHPQFIEKEAQKIFCKLSDENFLLNLNHDNFCYHLAHYHTELNALHPFREGNGRTLKLLLNELARRNGFYISWETNVDVDVYLDATIKAHNGPVANQLSEKSEPLIYKDSSSLKMIRNGDLRQNHNDEVKSLQKFFATIVKNA